MDRDRDPDEVREQGKLERIEQRKPAGGDIYGRKHVCRCRCGFQQEIANGKAAQRVYQHQDKYPRRVRYWQFLNVCRKLGLAGSNARFLFANIFEQQQPDRSIDDTKKQNTQRKRFQHRGSVAGYQHIKRAEDDIDGQQGAGQKDEIRTRPQALHLISLTVLQHI